MVLGVCTQVLGWRMIHYGGRLDSIANVKRAGKLVSQNLTRRCASATRPRFCEDTYMTANACVQHFHVTSDDRTRSSSPNHNCLEILRGRQFRTKSMTADILSTVSSIHRSSSSSALSRFHSQRLCARLDLLSSRASVFGDGFPSLLLKEWEELSV